MICILWVSSRIFSFLPPPKSKPVSLMTARYYLRPCLRLVLKVSWVTGSQVDRRDTPPFAHVPIMHPADHLCPDFVTAYVTYTRRSMGPTHTYVKKKQNIKPATYLALHYFLAFHIHWCSCPFFFECWHAVTKTTTTSYINDIFSFYILVKNTSGCISIYGIKDMWSNASETTSANCLSEHILNTSW